MSDAIVNQGNDVDVLSPSNLNHRMTIRPDLPAAVFEVADGDVTEIDSCAVGQIYVVVPGRITGPFIEKPVEHHETVGTIVEFDTMVVRPRSQSRIFPERPVNAR